MEANVREYVHRPFKEEVVAIGGHYKFTDEVRISCEGGDILYLKGYALFDTSCCGTGGCGYAVVQGFIEDWKTHQDSEGFFVTRFRSIQEPGLRRRVAQAIKEKEMVQQVQFV